MKYRPGRPVARAAWSLTPLAGAVLLTAVVPSAAVAARAASGTRTGTITLCRRYQHITVRNAAGTRFIVKNDNYGGRRECLVNRGRAPNFTVARSSARSTGTEPVAYPFILRGCSWGTCSPRSGLPRRVSALGRPAVTLTTSLHADGRWNAAFDVWFGTRALTTGQADGAELMIWLRSRGLGAPAQAPVTVVDHTRWYLLHWRHCRRDTCWNIVQFRRVRPTRAVTNLPLIPFITRAEGHGWVKRRWWAENIEAGFEVWRGGTGLATDWFWARA